MFTSRPLARHTLLLCGLCLIWGLPWAAIHAQEAVAPSAAETGTETQPAETETAPTESAETEASAADEKTAAATALAAGAAAQDFQVKFTAWKSLLKNLRDIRAEYLIAPEDALPELQAKFEQGIEEGKQAARGLRESAVAAYREAPNADREITRLLITSAADMIREDRYSDAKSLLQVLIDGGSQEKELDDLAGIAAYGTNDFSAAKAFLEQAQSQNSISAKGQQYLGSVDQLIDAWSDEEKIRGRRQRQMTFPVFDCRRPPAILSWSCLKMRPRKRLAILSVSWRKAFTIS